MSESLFPLRFLAAVFPWLAVSRLRKLIEQDVFQPQPRSVYDSAWASGYDRALRDVAYLIGVERD